MSRLVSCIYGGYRLITYYVGLSINYPDTWNSILYHTTIIILHRLPRFLLETRNISSLSSEDIRIRYESLDTIVKLLKTFSRLYPLSSLPLDIVYILSAAAGAIFMKRIVEKVAFNKDLISKPLACVFDVMGKLSETWPCMREIREGIVSYMRGQEQERGS
ncbi:hypothetical protein BDW69DRAFT_164655 [Aspergillus filifer]